MPFVQRFPELPRVSVFTLEKLPWVARAQGLWPAACLSQGALQEPGAAGQGLKARCCVAAAAAAAFP